MPYINSIANRMVDWVSSLIIFIHIMFWTGLIELAMIFMHKEGGLGKNMFDKIILLRRTIQVICTCIVFFTIWGVYQWTGHRLVNGLANHKCSSDAALQGTFNHMKEYLDQSQDIQRKTVMYVILGIVIGISVLGIYQKRMVLPKSYEYKENQKIGEDRIQKTAIN